MVQHFPNHALNIIEYLLKPVILLPHCAADRAALRRAVQHGMAADRADIDRIQRRILARGYRVQRLLV